MKISRFADWLILLTQTHRHWGFGLYYPAPTLLGA
jgi:hypothetical protein